MLLTLGGCSKESPPPPANVPATADTPATGNTPPAVATTEPDRTLTIALSQRPWVGDLDGMIERRLIRVLTVNSKMLYFHDKGAQRGIVVDAFRLFEEELNKRLAAEKKLKKQESQGAGGLHPGGA